MANNHGARQQKKLAKQKAKRSEKRNELAVRHSPDPTVRLRRADKWPPVEAYIGSGVWTAGIGTLVLARKAAEGELVYGVYLVDVYCLGVKNTFWMTGSPGQFRELLQKVEISETLLPISPACLVKVVEGGVAYAKALGFPPHPDYRHAALLFKGIEPSACAEEYSYGKDGKPFYCRGPNETIPQAKAIAQRVIAAGGDYVVRLDDLDDLNGDSVDGAEFDEDDDELPAFEVDRP